MLIPSSMSAVWIWNIYCVSMCVCSSVLSKCVRLLTYMWVWNICINLWWRSMGHVYVLKVRLQLKGRGNDCVKMALKELGAQLARPISVRVAADDSQISQPIIWALIYAQRGHSLPLTNQRPECRRLVTMANESSRKKCDVAWTTGGTGTTNTPTTSALNTLKYRRLNINYS